MIRYKNSKKRCNLYVKNFPPQWTEEDLKNNFGQFGDIERIKLEKGTGRNIYAFICFKQPDAASKAKSSLQGQTFDGKGLVINHYEIKEIRDLNQEEMRDKRDWEKYIQMVQGSGAFAWSQLSNQPNLSHIIQQLLSLMHQQQPEMRNNQRRFPPNNQRRINQQRPNQPQMMPQQNMQQPPMQMQAQMMPPQAPVQQLQQQAIPQTEAEIYLMKAQQILPSVTERNPYLGQQVGHLIYEYVEKQVGQQQAPKITGMLIELPPNQIRQYLQSLDALKHRVNEA